MARKPASLDRLILRFLKGSSARCAVASFCMGLVLSGCPQLLEDGFDLTAISADLGRPTGGGGGGGASVGSENAGAASSKGGTGGTAAVFVTPDGGGLKADSNGGAEIRSDAGAKRDAGPTRAGLDASSPAVDSGLRDASPPDASPLDSGSLVPVCTPEQRAAPEFCGCGVLPSSDCQQLRNALSVRYSFNGVGTVVDDAVGSLNGDVINGSLAGGGELEIIGTTFLSVPDNLASNLTNATFELWLTWKGGAAQQRIFNFGNRDAAATQHYFALAPQGGSEGGSMEVTFTSSGQSSEIAFLATRPVPLNVQSHVAVVINETANSLSLYIDGVQESSGLFNRSLSSLKDTTNWVGRSLNATDAFLEASLHEFRVYNVALSASAIAKSAELGPDAVFLAD